MLYFPSLIKQTQSVRFCGSREIRKQFMNKAKQDPLNAERKNKLPFCSEPPDPAVIIKIEFAKGDFHSNKSYASRAVIHSWNPSAVRHQRKSLSSAFRRRKTAISSQVKGKGVQSDLIFLTKVSSIKGLPA